MNGKIWIILSDEEDGGKRVTHVRGTKPLVLSFDEEGISELVENLTESETRNLLKQLEEEMERRKNEPKR